MLLPWARCEIFARGQKLPILAPQWVQPKIGPVLRRERDKRYYVGLFKSDGYIRGLKRWWLLATACRREEEKAESSNLKVESRKQKVEIERWSGNTVIMFSGLGRYFLDLAGHEDFLRQRLNEILADSCARILATRPEGPFIAVHIRRGDKPQLAPGTEPPPDSMHWAIPTEWYARCITQAQDILGKELPVVVFSDARPEQIAALFKLPNVSLASRNPAIVDMLLMSEATVLITTSSSTFSMWPSFLGRMPSIWFPARWREQTNFPAPELECYTDLQGNLPDSFFDILRRDTGERKLRAESRKLKVESGK